MSTCLLHVEGLDRHLGTRTLWQDIGFQLKAGDRLALVGPSGAGKTLLLRSLALLDPLLQGRILLQGRSPSAWTVPAYRARVVLVPQRPVAFPGSVEENLRQVFDYASHQGRRFERQHLLEWLAALQRDRLFLDLAAERLSGGEAQLLALLRALQLDPAILLLDEPTASLDEATTLKVEALLARWLGTGERACVLTSHDERQIRRFSQRCLSLTPSDPPLRP
jgi:putative ABC transport system ATP-binding protein